MAYHGIGWLKLAWNGMGLHWMVCAGNEPHRMARYGMIQHGYGMGQDLTAWDSMVKHGPAWYGIGWHWMVWDGIGWHGTAWDGMGWQGMAYDVIGWHGTA